MIEVATLEMTTLETLPTGIYRGWIYR